MSKTRKVYFARLAGRSIILILCCLLYLFRRDTFDVLLGMNFFKRLSLFHLLWVIWVADMILQIFPIRNKLPLGSQKLFSNHFRPIRERSTMRACAAMWSPPPWRPTRSL